MRKLLIAALALSCVSTPAVAGKTPDKNADPNKIVCKRDRESDTGSKLRAPAVCRTRAEWKELDDVAEQFVRRINERGQRIEPPAGFSGAGGPE